MPADTGPDRVWKPAEFVRAGDEFPYEGGDVRVVETERRGRDVVLIVEPILPTRRLTYGPETPIPVWALTTDAQEGTA